jgi:hypothetical protein
VTLYQPAGTTHRDNHAHRDGPRTGSPCSGVGGLDLGVQAALGGHIAWHAETDPRAAHVLAPPPGRVTGALLSHAAQLHLLGNSVIPQQATQALKTLLPEGIHHHRRLRWCGARAEGER